MSLPVIRPFQPHYLKAPRDFQPIPSDTMCLEIGAGKGKHACLFAQKYPKQRLYAVERTAEKFTTMQKQAAEYANLHPIHADALPWVVHAVYPQQVEQLFILYPNPEPHNATQRWLNMPFFEYLLSRVQAGGKIVLASNIESYIAEAAEQLQNVWQLPFVLSDVPADSARTHFEVKYLERGEHCQQLTISKPVDYCTRFDTVSPRLGQV